MAKKPVAVKHAKKKIHPHHKFHYAMVGIVVLLLIIIILRYQLLPSLGMCYNNVGYICGDC